MAREKILPKRTVFCCLAFDEKAIMLLGYAVALVLITSVFGWQASMQLWVPLGLGQNKPATAGSCIISNADLVCHDRFESDCQSLINVRGAVICGLGCSSSKFTNNRSCFLAFFLRPLRRGSFVRNHRP
jgi:hypothetical protein